MGWMSLEKSTFLSSAWAENPEQTNAAAKLKIWVSWDTVQNMADHLPEVDILFTAEGCCGGNQGSM